MIGRRGLFRGAMALIGGGAMSGSAKPYVAAALPDAPYPRLPKWFCKLSDGFYDDRNGVTHPNGFDLDLNANKSMSYAAKAIIQRRRDRERRNWLEKMREKAEREVGLS